MEIKRDTSEKKDMVISMSKNLFLGYFPMHNVH